tara:strand:+ start:2807 stop:3358 length:552 start_codon:yes stop_codon:yes gene_type:complete
MRSHHSHRHHIQFSSHERGGPRGGRLRAKRGAIREAILTLLAERPMHGYEIITELDSRSEGRWRPSPGTVYPALEKIEAHGGIASTEIDGKRQFALTDTGREFLTKLQEAKDEDAPPPWEQQGTGARGDLRRLLSELTGQLRQVGKFGSCEQRDAAKAILEDTKNKLYAVLAARPTNKPSDKE